MDATDSVLSLLCHLWYFGQRYYLASTRVGYLLPSRYCRFGMSFPDNCSTWDNSLIIPPPSLVKVSKVMWMLQLVGTSNRPFYDHFRKTWLFSINPWVFESLGMLFGYKNTLNMAYWIYTSTTILPTSLGSADIDILQFLPSVFFHSLDSVLT